MILTLLFFVFETRILIPKIENSSLLKDQKRTLNLVYYGTFLLKLLLGILIGYAESRLLILPFELVFVFVVFYFFKRWNHKKIVRECDRLLQKLHIDLQKHTSLYSSLTQFLSNSEAFKQHNLKKSFDYVLFAQQKRSVLTKIPELNRILEFLKEMRESPHYALDMLVNFREESLRRRKLEAKKSSLTQNARAQTSSATLLFLVLMGLQLKTYPWEILSAYLSMSVTIFGIGIMGIFFFLRSYV